MNDRADRLPTFYICHGAGPSFFMEWTMGPPDTYVAMGAWLRSLAATVPVKPRAIVVISGHWEEDVVAVQSAAKPSMLFDYYGFPPHTYELKYPAPGDPALAQRISGLLDEAGIANRLDPARGFDHGVFVPFLLIYPDADIPIVQVSMLHGYDPQHHLDIGRALEPLRGEGVLIVGSGASFHNRRGAPESEAWDEWLFKACTAPAEARDRHLARWTEAPYARVAHAPEDHLIPLMVAAGAAGESAGTRIFTDGLNGRRMSAYRFG
ncbi:class III extradiol ring-cleavage dioxygenase [soil metagenome]